MSNKADAQGPKHRRRDSLHNNIVTRICRHLRVPFDALEPALRDFIKNSVEALLVTGNISPADILHVSKEAALALRARR